MKKTLLLIAKDYPPSTESSGVQRVLKFSQYLPTFNWNVQVLTMWRHAYGKAVNDEQLAEIPASVSVKRTFALNTALHLSIKGRYFGWMALPDRWSSWLPSGLLTGLILILKNRPALIYSTYPCATAHLIALLLHRISRIKWVADFRDPMLYNNDHVKNSQYRIYNWIERQTIKYCSRAIFTTPGAIEHYAKVRYPEYPAAKWVLIANGFDEQSFRDCMPTEISNTKADRPLLLLHSGYLYRAERDPTNFFRGLADLYAQNLLIPGDIKIVLRAAGHETEYGMLINSYGLEDVILLEPAVPYKQALAEMLSADALLLFQGKLCNHQIPAKVYEYFQAKKPVFAFTDGIGDTAALLDEAGINTYAQMDDHKQIASEFLAFYTLLRSGKAPVPSDEFVVKQSRQSRTQQLASLLESVLLDG